MPSRRDRLATTRRDVLAGVGAVGSAALAGCSALGGGESNLSGDWTQIGFDATNRSAAVERQLPDDLTVAWRGEVGDWPYVPPVVRDGTVFVSDAGRPGAVDGDDEGSADDTDGEVSAFDAADGTVEWRRSLEHRISGSIAVTSEAVLVPTADRPGDAALLGLDVDSGDTRWRVDLEEPGFAVSVADGVAYLRSDAAALAVGTESDADTEKAGAVRWRTSLSPLRYDEYNAYGRDLTGLVAPAVDDDLVVLPDDGAVLALDRETGSERWRVPLRATLASPVAIDDGLVAVGLRETVALARDGAEQWRVDRGGWASVATDDESAYVTGRDRVTAHAIDDGEERWSANAGSEIQRSQPVVLADDVVVAGDSRVKRLRRGGGRLFGGREVGELEAGQFPIPDHGGVVVGGGRVFVRDRIGREIVALASANGSFL